LKFRVRKEGIICKSMVRKEGLLCKNAARKERISAGAWLERKNAFVRVRQKGRAKVCESAAKRKGKSL
jgi:hypothetical protein